MCPSESAIVAVAAGESSPGDAQAIRDHVKTCAACRRLLDKLEGRATAADDDRTGSAADDGPRARPLHTQDVGSRTSSEDSDAEALERGAMVGRYDILQHLASGGMGAVYAAYDPQLDRRVALKVLGRRGEAQGRERLQMRLQREAQAMARLQHPNVVAVHDVGNFQGRVFVAMEFVDGHTLREWLQEGRRTWQQIRDVFVQAGRGLAAAHAHGLIHRDFKPDNVLIGKDGRARVADFGLARPAHESQRDDTADLTTGTPDVPMLDTPLTQAGAVLGTPRYMAPEQILAEPADERTDQFSFAVALYESLYGVRAYPKGLQERLDAITSGAITPPPAGHGVPDWLGQAVRRALEADPARRYPSMDAFLEALQKDARKGRLGTRAMAAAAVVGLAVGGVAWALRPDLRCQGADRKLAGVWDRERREAVRSAFIAAQGAPGAEIFGRAARALDAYAERWVAMHEEACTATVVRREQPESVLGLRMACLDLRLKELKYLTGLFAGADAKLSDRSVDAVLELTSVRSCGDITALTELSPLPEDPAAREAIKRVSEQLTEVNALRLAGQYQAALEKATAARQLAAPLRYRPVEAEALFLEGMLQERSGKRREAVDTLKAAIWAADAGRVDLVKARAASRLLLAAADLSQFDAARDWGNLAQSALERLGGQAEYEAELLINRSAAAIHEGLADQAVAASERARQLLAAEVGREHPKYLNASTNLAQALLKQGRTADALAILQESTESIRRLRGPEHPTLIAAQFSTADALLRQRDFARAHQAIDEALRIARARLGPEHVRVAGCLELKASISLEEGRHAEALATFQQALEIKLRILQPKDPDLSYAYDGIGQVLLAMGKPAEAQAALEAALALQVADPAARADTQYGLARALWQVGRDRRAAVRYGEEARSSYEKAQNPGRAQEVAAWLAARR
jgi:tetratricopeptide (TPR) repeat protein/predicted Ser/Thr protein kinase